MKGQGTRTDLGVNHTEVKHGTGQRAYTLSRLQKQNPALFARVVAGELSANAAAKSWKPWNGQGRQSERRRAAKRLAEEGR